MANKEYVIGTDGACKNNQAAGGQKGTWAFSVLRVSDNTLVGSKGGADSSTTNNRMEMTAVLEALRWLNKHNKSAVIVMDSSLVFKGLTEWLSGWRKRGWKKSDGSPVANADLWKEICLELDKKPNIELAWCRGHQINDSIHTRVNNAADQFCNELYLKHFI